MNNDLQQEELLASRMLVYNAFQIIFGNEPDRNLINHLRQVPLREAFATMSAQVPAFSRKLSDNLTESISTEAFTDDDSLAELRSQYTRFFIGPGKLIAPPWESVHRSKDNLLFQVATLDVRRAFKAQGFEAYAIHRLPDDHLAIELDFMAKLAQRAYGALSDGEATRAADALSASLSFLQEHLLIWVPQFAALLNKNDANSFYAIAATVLNDCLNLDADALSSWLER